MTDDRSYKLRSTHKRRLALEILGVKDGVGLIGNLDHDQLYKMLEDDGYFYVGGAQFGASETDGKWLHKSQLNELAKPGSMPTRPVGVRTDFTGVFKCWDKPTLEDLRVVMPQVMTGSLFEQFELKSVSDIKPDHHSPGWLFFLNMMFKEKYLSER